MRAVRQTSPPLWPGAGLRPPRVRGRGGKIPRQYNASPIPDAQAVAATRGRLRNLSPRVAHRDLAVAEWNATMKPMRLRLAASGWLGMALAASLLVVLVLVRRGDALATAYQELRVRTNLPVSGYSVPTFHREPQAVIDSIYQTVRWGGGALRSVPTREVPAQPGSRR